MSTDSFTYPEVGATRAGAFPAGYRHLRYRVRLGPATALPAAGEAIMTWRMLRGAGVQVAASAPRAAEGVRITSRLGLGPLRISAPCQVVWTVETDDRVGFGYGTLPGHPFRGEESFLVERDSAGEVWFALRSFSQPARWFVRPAGPVAPLLQREFARRCGCALRRLG